MKRVVVALAVLLATYGLARADYVIIVYNLGVQKDKTNGVNGGMPGAFRGMPGGAFGMAGAGGMAPPGMGGGVSGGGGSPGPPGGVGGGRGIGGGVSGGGGLPGPPGGMGGGAPGFGGGTRPPGFGGAGGASGTVPPGAMGGIPGGMGGGVPGGMGGVPGGMGGMRPPGGMVGPPGGFGGAGGMQPPGGMVGPPGGFGGAGGMQPPPGMAGGFGLTGGFGLMGGVVKQPEEHLTPLYALAIVEVEKVKKYPGGTIHVTHKWGSSFIVPKAQENHVYSLRFSSPSIKARHAKQLEVLHPAKPTAEGLRELAEWELKHDLLDDFVKTMEDLAKLDPKHESVIAFQQVQQDMAKPITKPDVSDFWRSRIGDNYRVERLEHYSLLHNMEADRGAPVQGRLNRLENNYRAFFYWFALQGKALKVPDQRLVAVLVKHGDEFKRQQQIFDSLPSVADGFLARRDNLAVFSLERTDAASEALEQNTKVTWQKLTTTRDDSLKHWPRGARGERLDDAFGREIQTIALLERALEDDAEIASVTHEGTRQLLAATNELPRNVAVPEWLQFGWASFFETPKGSPWMTVGSPSSTLLPEYNYLSQYKAAFQAGKLEKQRVAMLEKVVTDAYFREYAANPKSEEARVKARTLSWALTYFLANKKLDGLRRYHEELKKLPRDLEFDPAHPDAGLCPGLRLSRCLVPQCRGPHKADQAGRPVARHHLPAARRGRAAATGADQGTGRAEGQESPNYQAG